jgi:hypothetical protein
MRSISVNPKKASRHVGKENAACAPSPIIERRVFPENSCLEIGVGEKKKTKKSGIQLTTEAGLELYRPSAKILSQVISGLDTGNGNSFCCLKSSDGNYVQALHGVNGWHVEWRLTDLGNGGRYHHYRAGKIAGSNRKRLLRKSDKFVSRGLERELLETEDVLDCFETFLRAELRPKCFKWRKLKI